MLNNFFVVFFCSKLGWWTYCNQMGEILYNLVEEMIHWTESNSFQQTCNNKSIRAKRGYRTTTTRSWQQQQLEASFVCSIHWFLSSRNSDSSYCRHNRCNIAFSKNRNSQNKLCSPTSEFDVVNCCVEIRNIIGSLRILLFQEQHWGWCGGDIISNYS